MDFTDSTIVITGGNSGVGRAAARAFALKKAKVFIIGRNQQTLSETAQSLGSNVRWLQADVSKHDQVASAITAVREHSEQIDVLVNAAGLMHRITTSVPLIDAERLWDEVLDINLKGSFLMALAATPHLKHHSGRIINISSMAAFTGGSRPGTMAYAAAKAGLHGLTYGLARELGSQGITVNSIAPSYIADTSSTIHWSQERLQDTIAQTPIGRMSSVDDVVHAILYLASPEASFITGEILNINGGLLFGR